MDVRPGGEWRVTMISEVDGTTHPFVGVYREVEEPTRLVFTLDNPHDRRDPKVEVVTVTFTGNLVRTCVYRQLEAGELAGSPDAPQLKLPE